MKRDCLDTLKITKSFGWATYLLTNSMDCLLPFSFLRLKIQCSIQGTTIVHLSNTSKFWDIMPYDITNFLNNQTGLRIVFALEGQAKDSLIDFVRLG